MSLRDIFNQLTEEIILSETAEEAKKILSKELGMQETDFKPVSAKRFKILVPRQERMHYVNAISELEGFVYDRNMRGSSIGGFLYNGISIMIKPVGEQGRASAGLDNEDILENSVKEYASQAEPVDVYLKSSDDEIIVSSVISAEGVGTHTSKYKKTDIILKREGEKDFNISLKKDNAEFWESSDSRYREIVKDFVEEIKSEKHPKIYFRPVEGKTGIFKMYSRENDKLISGAIKRIEDLADVKDIVFGGKEVDAVITRTFNSKDFEYIQDESKLIIHVSEILTDIKDLIEQDKWPVLKIRHDSTRDKTFGLRPVVQISKAAGKGNVIDLDR